MAERKGLGAPIPTASTGDRTRRPARSGAVEAAVPTREAANLVLVVGEMTWPLTGARLLVGRAGGKVGADIELDDDSVSRRHAELVATPEGWLVRDLGSTNETKVDGRALLPGEVASVGAGSKVRFGSVCAELGSRNARGQREG